MGGMRIPGKFIYEYKLSECAGVGNNLGLSGNFLIFHLVRMPSMLLMQFLRLSALLALQSPGMAVW